MPNQAYKAAQQMIEVAPHLPPSVNGSPMLYCLALASVMCIATLGGYVVCWMGSEIWKDRRTVKFNAVVFNFRLMMGMAGLAAFCRSLPEVFYLQMYGDARVNITTQAVVMTAKRVADSTSILFVISWVWLLAMIYPFVIRALVTEGPHGTVEHVVVDDYPSIKRLMRPMIVFMLIFSVAVAFTFGKVYGI